MTLSLRTRLLLVAALPPAGLAVLVAFGPPPVILAAAAVAAGTAAAAGVALLTRDFLRLQASADQLLRLLDTVADSGNPVGGYPVHATDGTGAVARCLAAAETNLIALGRLVRHRDQNLKDALTRTAKVLTTAAEGKQAGAVVLPDLSCPREAQQLVAAVGKLVAAHATETKRAAAFLAILHDTPDPLLVFDAKSLDLSFQNAAADRFYRHLVGSKKKPTLDQFFAPPPAGAVVEHDAPPVHGPAALKEWLLRGTGGVRTGLAGGPHGQTAPVEVAACPQFERKSPHYVTALVRDLSAAREAEATSRRRQRQLVGQRLCRLLSRESKPALSVIRTQTNLLSQAAKQIGQRERLLPKVTRIVEETSRQELVVELLDWMGMLSAGQAGDPDIQEVRLGEVAKTVGERLRPGFEERGNTLEVTDEAGWVLADESWVSALVTGLLAHANQACEKATVSLNLGRRSAVQAHDEFAVITVSHPGKPLTAPLVEDVRDPFRRPDSAVFDPDRPGGLPLGLAVAHRLAGHMYGEFLADAGTDGRPYVRVVLPTRIGKPHAAEKARMAVAIDTAAENEDLLGSWGVGGQANEPDQAETPAPVEAAAAPHQPEDDTVANWFGGPSD